jgi:hypothetical protein
MRRLKPVLTLLVLAVGLLLGSPAWAHSFDTIFVVPLSGSQAAAGKQARDGFMFAARERDGHPNETADGHLGGLDVFLLIVDSTAGEGEVVAKLRELTGGAADDTPRVVAPPALLEPIRGQISEIELLAIDLTTAVHAETRTMDGRLFSTAFEDDLGYAPTQAVYAGYAAARQIDAAVRAGN